MIPSIPSLQNRNDQVGPRCPLRAPGGSAGFQPAVSQASSLPTVAARIQRTRAVLGAIRSSSSGPAKLHFQTNGQHAGSPRSSRLEACATSRGFSLIEFVGVLAVLAILAAVSIPVMIRRIDRAAWTKEAADTAEIAKALKFQALRTKSIPSDTTWASAAATWTMRPTAQITTTPRNYTRQFVFDTNGWLGTSAPYTQTAYGTYAPTNARALLISTIQKTLPVIGPRLSTVTFNTLWNAQQDTVPSSLSSWGGRGEDLIIQRINFQPMFHQVILINHDTNNAAMFTIDGSASTNVPFGGLGWNAWYLEGSVLGLNSNATVQTRYVVNKSTSFVFENGAWLGQIMNGPVTTNVASGFASSAVNFFNSQWNTRAGQGPGSQGHQTVDQGAVLGSMVNFMLDWTMWATPKTNELGRVVSFYEYGVGQSQVKTKLQIWNLLDTEAVADQANNAGNIKSFSNLLLQ